MCAVFIRRKIMDLIKQINELKKQKNAIILTHCYQNIEIDEVSDFVGDSLYLSKMAAQTDAEIIVFAGVYFMAQSAKLLSPNKKVLFVPDNYLGKYVQEQLPNIEIITFNGYCPIHQRIRVEEIENARKNYPNAIICTHPECNQEVAKRSDFIGSTKEIMEYVVKSDKKQFVIATEKGVVDRLNRDSRKFNWNKEFILIDENIICPDMKKNTLEGIYNTLLNETNEIKIEPDIAKKAVQCIDKMFEITK